MTDWRHDRIGSAQRGENPLVLARMRSGFAVIGDTQHLPGYSVLLTNDVSADHLTDLDWERRRDSCSTCRCSARQSSAPADHMDFGASTTRCSATPFRSSTDTSTPGTNASPADKIGGPVWRYPKEVRNDPAHAYSDERHGELRAALTAELTHLMELAYTTT